MLIKRLIPCLLTAALILPVFAYSQTQEIKEYRVKKGDTLWDISNSELKDPFLWPKVWKENPEIKNPDRIYPGQIIRIPLYLLKKETKEETIAEPIVEKAPEPVKEEVRPEPAPVKIKPIISKALYLASGYLADSLIGAGKITGSPDGKNLFGNNDIVYVQTEGPVNIGDKFYIVRKGQEVIHPVSKKKMGFVIQILGVAEISKFEYGETLAKILVAFNAIVTDDVISTFYDMEPPVVSRPFRKPDMDGYVVAARNYRIMNANYDIVYIDKGLNDGLQAGDLLKTLAVGAHRVPNGTIQIISLKDKTATAVIVSSTAPVTAGNEIKPLE
jgi:hypothetical protein